jgi:hypothetical protein
MPSFVDTITDFKFLKCNDGSMKMQFQVKDKPGVIGRYNVTGVHYTTPFIMNAWIVKEPGSEDVFVDKHPGAFGMSTEVTVYWGERNDLLVVHRRFEVKGKYTPRIIDYEYITAFPSRSLKEVFDSLMKVARYTHRR